MRVLLAVAVCVWTALAGGRAAAVAPRFDPQGGGFYDLPFPHELRRDTDGTVSVAGFPFPAGNAIVAAYAAAFEEVRGFGLNSAVYFAFDGDLDPATLPVDGAASRSPGAAVFLLDIDPRSSARGTRVRSGSSTGRRATPSGPRISWRSCPCPATRSARTRSTPRS